MRHLHGWPPGNRMEIEGEESERSELLQCLIEGDLVDGKASQLALQDPPASRTCRLIDSQQTEEDLLGGRLTRRRQRVVDLVGSSAQSSEDTSRRPVEICGQKVSLPLGEHLCQGVLEERQTSRLSLDVTEHVVDQSWFEVHSDPLCRSGDRLCQTLLGRETDGDDSVPHHFGEGRILERSIEEVRP